MRALPPTDSLIDHDASEVVLALAWQLPGAIFSFLSYRPTPPVEERMLGNPTGETRALSAEEMTALLASRPGLARELTRHESGAEEPRTTRLRSAEVLAGALQELSASLAHGEVLGIRSECVLDEAVAHLPLMDFRVERGPTAAAALLSVAPCAAPWGGILLDSGRSYHLYGAQLLPWEQWVAFMGRCLLLSPLTDPRFVGHRLLAGFGVLRLTTSSLKPVLPRVIAAF
jgi:hypothetical protein